ncbi:hypothetical protein [Streptomyces sp. NPDC049949]|uniref:hypothetical protein n=1 Tax=Streptomyces sp. NPDC049949 TaxID=3154627 RepID=UPI00342C6DF9
MNSANPNDLQKARAALHPYRADSESVHSQFHLSLRNRRVIAYGTDRQKVFVLGF